MRAAGGMFTGISMYTSSMQHLSVAEDLEIANEIGRLSQRISRHQPGDDDGYIFNLYARRHRLMGYRAGALVRHPSGALAWRWCLCGEFIIGWSKRGLLCPSCSRRPKRVPLFP